ncbi:MAG: hypothetical protein HYR81_00700 [Nitrospirae bacterium]|nr:hypothetical protein [Nitrospirota bacterium]
MPWSQLIIPRLSDSQVTASGEVRIASETPTVTNRVPDQATPNRKEGDPDDLVVHRMPSGEVKIIPPYPTATNWVPDQASPGILKDVPDDRIVVSESGIDTRADVEAIESTRTDAILVGTSIMKADDIGKKIDELMGKI